MSQRIGVVEVVGPEGEARMLRCGETLMFGRDPAMDLPVGDDPWLSRRAGEICVMADGVRVSNLSKKHALHIRLKDDTLRLPAAGSNSGDVGCFLVSGTVEVGSGAMVDQRRAVRIVLPDLWQQEEPAPPAEVVDVPGRADLVDGCEAEGTGQSTTVLPIRLQAGTKEFMVAFVLCRPWLEDPTRIAPLPSAPQIAEAALQITGAHHLLRALPDPAVRDRLSQQVHEHLKGLRAKLRQRRLVRPDIAVSPTVIASTLLHYDVVGPHHLALLNNTDWLSIQEDKWWGDQ
jgi:hypothetical protein